MNRYRFIGSLLLAISLVGIAPTSAKIKSGNARLSEEGLLLIGRVTENPRSSYPGLKLLADYVIAHLRDVGITRAEIRFTDTNAEMIELLRREEVDIVPESAFSAIEFRAKAGAELMLHEWREGAARYHSILIARKDSQIERLSDLKGKIIAFEDPGSSAGYLLPHAHLERHGLDLVELADTRQTPLAGTSGYVFATQEVNIVTWVYRGWADVGALSNEDWGDPSDVPPAFEDELAIVFRTPSLPSSFMLARGDLPHRVNEGIKQALMTINGNLRAQAALAPYRGVTRYDEITDKDLAELKRLEALESLHHID